MKELRSGWRPAAVFLMALLPRLALYPYFRFLDLSGDESAYWSEASHPFGHYQFHPPVWSMALWPARLLTDNPAGGRLLAVFYASVTVVLVFILASRLFGRRTGWTAAILLSLYPDNIVWSHFLWAEIFFTLTVVVTCLFFFPEDRNDPPRLLSAGLPAGVSFMTKEFAVVFFGAMVVSHFFSAARRKIRTFLLASLLFLTPMAAYVGIFYLKTGRLHVAMGGLRTNASHAARVSARATSAVMAADDLPASHLRSRLWNVGESLKRIWGARSFALWRLSDLLGPSSPKYFPAMVITHALILLLGLIGLVTEEPSSFSIFAWAAIVLLCFASIPGFLISRFRTSFMFLFVIEAARALSMPLSVSEKLASPRRYAVAIAFVVGMAALCAVTYRYAGHWG